VLGGLSFPLDVKDALYRAGATSYDDVQRQVIVSAKVIAALPLSAAQVRRLALEVETAAARRTATVGAASRPHDVIDVLTFAAEHIPDDPAVQALLAQLLVGGDLRTRAGLYELPYHSRGVSQPADVWRRVLAELPIDRQRAWDELALRSTEVFRAFEATEAAAVMSGFCALDAASRMRLLRALRVSDRPLVIEMDALRSIVPSS
jgi:hypothetical protein